MPGRDGTGPMGRGAMTGRAAGFCQGVGMTGYSNPAPGRGFGRGRGVCDFGGGRRGWRNMYHATGQPGWMRFGGAAAAYRNADPELEKQALRRQAEILQSELELIKKRLSRIVNETASE